MSTELPPAAMDAHARAIAATRPQANHDPLPEAGLVSRRVLEVTALSSMRAEDAALAFDSEEQWPPIPAPAADARSRDDDLRARRRRFDWSQIPIKPVAIAVVSLIAAAGLWIVTAPAPTGWVSITSDPAGAYVKVDGTLTSITPFGALLPAGEHKIEVAYGAAVRAQTIQVTRGGETVMHLELKTSAANATGGLQISTEPATASVWVDGTLRGDSPATVQDLAPGTHEVTVKSGRTSVTRKVDVQAGAVASLIISMTPAQGPGSGWLTVSSPVAVQIFKGETLLGTTAAPRIMLPSGRHELEFINEDLGYFVQRAVQITAGETSSIQLDIPRGTLFVNVLPWAEVWLDGQRVGETPIGNLSVPVGRHELVVRHPELGQQRQTVIVNAGAPVRVGLDLRR